MRKYSYESILSAVGRVLDLAEAHSFAIHESTGSLTVEALDETGKPSLVLPLDVTELARLVDWVESSADRPNYERASSSDEGTLRHFLAQHERELVGAH